MRVLDVSSSNIFINTHPALCKHDATHTPRRLLFVSGRKGIVLREMLRVKGDAFNSCVLSEKLPIIAPVSDASITVMLSRLRV